MEMFLLKFVTPSLDSPITCKLWVLFLVARENIGSSKQKVKSKWDVFAALNNGELYLPRTPFVKSMKYLIFKYLKSIDILITVFPASI